MEDTNNNGNGSKSNQNSCEISRAAGGVDDAAAYAVPTGDALTSLIAKAKGTNNASALAAFGLTGDARRWAEEHPQAFASCTNDKEVVCVLVAEGRRLQATGNDYPSKQAVERMRQQDDASRARAGIESRLSRYTNGQRTASGQSAGTCAQTRADDDTGPTRDGYGVDEGDFPPRENVTQGSVTQGGNMGAVTQDDGQSVTQGEPADVTHRYTGTQEHRGIQSIQRETARAAAPLSAGAEGNGDAREHPRVVEAVKEERRANRRRAEWYRQNRECSFDQFVIRAIEFQWAKDEPEWHSPMFWFVYLLRGHEDVQGILLKKVITKVELIMRLWTRSETKKGGTPRYGYHNGDTPKGDVWAEWFGRPKGEVRAEFVDLWESMRFMPGHDALDQAVANNRRVRIILPTEISDYRPVGDPGAHDEMDYEFFFGIAAWLQTIMGNRPIMLPCERVGTLMKVSKMTISRYRKWAVQDGLLRITKTHKFRSNGTGEATEFRADVSRWKKLASLAQPGTIESFNETEIRLTGI